MLQCQFRDEVPQLSTVTWESCRTNGSPCSCSTSATNESCTFRGPWPLREAEPSLLTSQALSDRHQNDETPAKYEQHHQRGGRTEPKQESLGSKRHESTSKNVYKDSSVRRLHSYLLNKKTILQTNNLTKVQFKHDF